MTARRPLAILCGRGALPLQAADIARKNGRSVFLVGLAGAAEPEIEAFDHLWVKLGEVGKTMSALKARGIADFAMLGAVARPEFHDVKLDWGAFKRAGEIARLFRGGDDGLLKGIARLLEAEGLNIVGVADFAPELLAPLGRIAGPPPNAEAQADVAFGRRLVEALSPFDVGQGVVVARERTLAVEAAEGTDAMLERVAEMRANGQLKLKGRVGVLVKAAKRGQDVRFDLPAVGLRTIDAAGRAKLAGLAIAAGQALIAEREEFAAAAENAGLFVIGF